MEIASILLIVGCIAAGVVSGVLRTWALHRRVYSLEDRVSMIEGNLTREVKARAGQERWKKLDKDAELMKSLQGSPAVTGRKLNWWELNTPAAR